MQIKICKIKCINICQGVHRTEIHKVLLRICCVFLSGKTCILLVRLMLCLCSSSVCRPLKPRHMLNLKLMKNNLKEKLKMTHEIIDTELKEIESNILRLKNQAAESIIQLGYELIRAKEKLPHGEWGDWLKNRVNFSQRTANLYMKIAKEFGSNSQSISNLEVTKLGLLLDVPEEKRVNFIEEHNVKDMSTRQLKEAIRSSSEKEITGSCIDYIRDSEEVEIDVDALKPMPNHEKYFFKRTGKDWIHFLNSVDKYGIYEPIIIARDNTIISGHDRVRACKDLGIKTIRAVYAFKDKESRKDCKDDDELKLKMFILSNFSFRSVDGYIAEFWMDELFGTSYGDKSGELSHYLTDEVVDRLNHNRNVMNKMQKIIEKKENGEITEEEMDAEISKAHEEYI